jgi:hypothetical protein
MMNKKSIAIGAAIVAGLGVGCGGDDNTGPLGNVDSLIILQRPKRNDMGDIFQYTSYIPGAKLVKLSPPTADGKQTVICCDKAGAEFANIDISGYDISFDAKQIVFAGKLSDNTKYGLFILTLADGHVEQIMTDPGRDYTNPIFLPGDKIMFTTNAVVEAGAPQHVDEYERAAVATSAGRAVARGCAPCGARHRSNDAARSTPDAGRAEEARLTKSVDIPTSELSLHAPNDRD